MRRWEHTLEQQADLWRWWDTEEGKRFARGWLKSFELKYGVEQTSLVSEIATIERARLLMAEPFYATEEIMDVWDYATSGFKPEPLMPSDFLTGAGFVYLPRAQYITDVHGKKTSFRAFMWSPAREKGQRGRDGIMLSMYSEVGDADDYWDDEPDTISRQGELLLVHVTPWWFGDAYPWDDASKLSEYSVGANYDMEMAQSALFSTVQPIQCFWRLAQQRISDRARHEAPRSTRRRASRLKEELDRYVTVIRLRRPKGQKGDEGGGGREYSHRWIVGGFWRNHYYPSLQARRQLYIAPHVKGPKDKPLRLREKRVFEFVK